MNLIMIQNSILRLVRDLPVENKTCLCIKLSKAFLQYFLSSHFLLLQVDEQIKRTWTSVATLSFVVTTIMKNDWLIFDLKYTNRKRIPSQDWMHGVFVFFEMSLSPEAFRAPTILCQKYFPAVSTSSISFVYFNIGEYYASITQISTLHWRILRVNQSNINPI